MKRAAEPWIRLKSGRNLAQHFQANLAGGDFTQSGHAGLVARFDLGGVTLAQHASAVGGSQHQLEAVRDLLQAIFNGDAGHVRSPTRAKTDQKANDNNDLDQIQSTKHE